MRASQGSAAAVEVDEEIDVYAQYSLPIRRAPENRVVAALELLSPSNKGVGNRLDMGKHLRKRSSLREAAVNLLEVDALTRGERQFPTIALERLDAYKRIVWTAFHDDASRKFRGSEWQEDDPLPVIHWAIQQETVTLVNLSETARAATEFIRWADLVASTE